MEAFFENDLAVLPLHQVFTEGISDFACVCQVIKYLEEQIVAALVLYHEWVGYKTSFDIRYICCAKYRILDVGRIELLYRRISIINTDCPGFATPAIYFFFKMFSIACNEWQCSQSQKDKQSSGYEHDTEYLPGVGQAVISVSGAGGLTANCIS